MGDNTAPSVGIVAAGNQVHVYMLPEHRDCFTMLSVVWEQWLPGTIVRVLSPEKWAVIEPELAKMPKVRIKRCECKTA